MFCALNEAKGMGINMKHKSVLKNVLTFIAIPVVGYILLLLTFMLDALFQMAINRFLPFNYNMTVYWLPISKHILFAAIILIIALFVFKSKLKDLYKAVFASVPTAVILITEGIFLYRWPAVEYSICLLTYGIIIFYIYKTKRSWIYYYSVSWVALALLVMAISGVEI